MRIPAPALMDTQMDCVHTMISLQTTQLSARFRWGATAISTWMNAQAIRARMEQRV